MCPSEQRFSIFGVDIVKNKVGVCEDGIIIPANLVPGKGSVSVQIRNNCSQLIIFKTLFLIC